VSRNGPVQILDAAPASGSTTVSFGDERVMLDVNIALPEEDVERIRTGYVCIRCLEPQPHPFPTVCQSKLPDGTLWCKFPIGAKQLEEFAIMFKGTVKLGSSINVADEIERLREFDEYEARTGLLIPPEVRNRSGAL
jgi:hypothetical protein